MFMSTTQGLLKFTATLPGPTPRASDSTDLGWGPGITIFTKLPGGSHVQVQRGEEALEDQEKS